MQQEKGSTEDGSTSSSGAHAAASPQMSAASSAALARFRRLVEAGPPPMAPESGEKHLGVEPPQQIPPEVARLTTLVLPLATALDEAEAVLDTPDCVPQFVLDEREAEQSTSSAAKPQDDREA